LTSRRRRWRPRSRKRDAGPSRSSSTASRSATSSCTVSARALEASSSSRCQRDLDQMREGRYRRVRRLASSPARKPLGVVAGRRGGCSAPRGQGLHQHPAARLSAGRSVRRAGVISAKVRSLGA
jgi:hypothetical protein